MKDKWIVLVAAAALLLSCTSGNIAPAPQPLTPEQEAKAATDSLKNAAAAGDLLVRLGDDLLSYQIKFMNELDHRWSHAGLVVEKSGQKLVAHIAPEDAGKDVVQYIPIDSFLNPQKNISCGLYRYDLSGAEKDSLDKTIQGFKDKGIRFDRIYYLKSDDELYCSEMIGKALRAATGGRINVREIKVPPRMLKALYNYFEGKATLKEIADRDIITIDNLYRTPHCQEIVTYDLKKLPGS